MPVTVQEIRRVINSLGLSGHALCLHSSLHSFGWVEGGASTVVQGILAEGCTVLVPTFSWDAFSVPALPGMRPERNGYNYALVRPPMMGVNRVYTPETQEIDMEVETGGCSEGFERLAPLLSSIERRIQVGQSVWRVFPAQDTLEIAQQAIRQNPEITYCGDEDCGRCRDAIAGGPLLEE